MVNGRRSRHAGIAAVLMLVGSACDRGSSDGAADGLGERGGSLGTAGAHEHGVARVNIAVEGDGALIEFIAPGQSIYGFEGEARSAEQEAARETGLERLRQQIPEMFVFDPSLGCRFGSPRVALEDGDHAGGEAPEEGGARDAPHPGDQEAEANEGDTRDPTHEAEHAAGEAEHDEVHAQVEVQCARTPVGTDLRVAVTESFPEIVQLDLQVLSAAQQSGARVTASGHTIRL